MKGTSGILFIPSLQETWWLNVYSIDVHSWIKKHGRMDTHPANG